MDKKILGLLCVLLLLWSCAGVFEYRSEEKRFYEDHSIEELWQAAADALTDCGYTITVSDRIAGILQGVKKSAIFGRSEGVFMTVRISEENGKVRLSCSVDKTRAVVFTSGSDLVKKVLLQIKKNLED